MVHEHVEGTLYSNVTTFIINQFMFIDFEGQDVSISSGRGTTEPAMGTK